MNDLTLDLGLPPIVTPPNPNPIMAFDPERTTNAQLMVDVMTLGYLSDQTTILDPTYGLGWFWADWTPTRLTGTDIDPNKSLTGRSVDFTDLPYANRSFDAVVFDPPYKSGGGKPDKSSNPHNGRYGVDVPRSKSEKWSLIERGLTECARVTKQWLFVKCQDQQHGDAYDWKTILIQNHIAETTLLTLEDMLFVSSYRPQPAGTRQLHARRNHSTLLVFKGNSA